VIRVVVEGGGGDWLGAGRVKEKGGREVGSVGRDGGRSRCGVGGERRCESGCGRARGGTVAVGVMVVA